MTIEIRVRENFPLWYRTAGTDDPWTQLIDEYAKMLPGQRWELSQDGIKPVGTLSSGEEGKGGRWSGFISPITKHEVRQIGTAPVYVHGE